jgi:sugar/nucleoside kinase (ribokinase family)
LTAPAAFLCVGAAHWDVVGRTAHPLPPGADVPGRVARRPGGVAQNVARALAALGRPIRLLAPVGRDAEGDALAADLAAAGVDCTWLCRHPGPTDSYVAIEGRDGALHAGVADCAGLEAVGASLLAPLGAAAWPGRLVADGNLPAEVLAAALDAAPGAAFVPASPRKLAALGALLFARSVTLYLNRAEAEALCGRGFPDSRSAAQAVWARGAREVVVTDGAAPATATDGAGLVTLAPPRVASPTSTTGAGDAFVAAHLAAAADGLDARASLAAGLDAAARHVAGSA